MHDQAREEVPRGPGRGLADEEPAYPPYVMASPNSTADTTVVPTSPATGRAKHGPRFCSTGGSVASSATPAATSRSTPALVLISSPRRDAAPGDVSTASRSTTTRVSSAN
ncbi:MAG: hypothetical protein ACRYG2_13225, partial [Janthinobacterium lividum]